MKYKESKIILEQNFEVASKFLDNLESTERIQKGFNTGTSTNLHYYLNNWFLFRVEFFGHDAIKIDYRNRKIPNKISKSLDFFAVLKKLVANSNPQNHHNFYQEIIVINNSNKEYLELLDEATEVYYKQTDFTDLANNIVQQNRPSISNIKSKQSVEQSRQNRIQAKNSNIRNASGINEGYYKINREERNLCAILFHTLLLDDNLNLFLKKIGCDFPIIDSEIGIYLEYAFIRDIWENIRNKFGITEGNKIKRKIILDNLNLSNTEKLEAMSVFDFNNFFVRSITRNPSSKEIESPGNWSIEKYDTNIQDNDEFLTACKFKWSFNAKPDIVINTSNDHAICIEGKFKSGEGSYPTNKNEKSIFHRRGIPFVGQLSIQVVIMNLLGIDSKFVLLANSRITSNTHDFYTWKEVFNELETSNCPTFIKEWLNRSDIK